MAKQDIELVEVWQNLKDKKLLENIIVDPSYVRRFYCSNIFQRTLAHLIGEADSGAVKIGATESGAVKVASSGTALTHNETIAKFTSADAYAEKTFSQVCDRVDITVWTFSVIVKRKPTAGASYEGEIEIPAGTMYSFDCSTEHISVKNQNAGDNALCQIVGWY